MKLSMRTMRAVVSVSLIVFAMPSFSNSTGTKQPSLQTSMLTPMKSTRVAGYLSADALPNSLTLLPPPPAAGSPAFNADEQAYRLTRSLRDTPRWTLASQDADLQFPEAAGAFSCAVDAPISEAQTPHLYMLLRRTLADGGFSVYAAKNHYRRDRPFVQFKERSCVPQDESRLQKDGSYPSGHASVGWTWALVLTELAPDRIDAVLQRGYAFGESRVICGVHWQSDVDASRVVAAGVVARLHADSKFAAEMRAAKAELAAVRAKHVTPTRDCAGERAALTINEATNR